MYYQKVSYMVNMIVYKVELLLHSVVETSTSWHCLFGSALRISVQNGSGVVSLRYVVYRSQFV